MSETTTHPNREAWLNALAEAMRPAFEARGLTLPSPLRVSCGWPTSGALSGKGGSRTIGQCFYPECSKDKATEVFVSPVLDEAERVADVLTHELVHAALGPGKGHGRVFAKAAASLGLEGKPTETHGGEQFLAWVRPLLAEVGAYPHASLDVTKAPVKRQVNRQLKVACGTCGYTARTTRKWLELAGAPLCPCNGEQMDEVDPRPAEEPEDVPEAA